MPGQAVVTIKDKQWSVAIANTYVELTSGLSGVASIPPQTGVLFDLGYDQKYIVINMSQMLFPLDIVLINSTQGVVGILQNVQPGLNAYLDNKTYPGARCFLEVNAGEAEGIVVGDSVAIEGYAQTTTTQFDISSLGNIMVAAMLVAFMVKMTDNVLSPPKKPALPPGYKRYSLPGKPTGGKIAQPGAEENLQEKQKTLEGIGRSIAKEAGVEFVRLDVGWEAKYSTPRYWFSDSRGHEIVATDLTELKWKLEKLLPQTVPAEHYVKIIAPGKTYLTIGSVVTRDELERENNKARERGGQPATAEVWEGGKPVVIRPKVIPTEKTRAQPDKLEYLADSPEFLTQTIEAIGYRDKLDSTFQEAIRRAKELK